MPDEHEQEFRDEADLLRQLSPEDQLRFIAMLRQDAENPKVPKRDRDFAHERADVLERLLRRARRLQKLSRGSTRMRLFRALSESIDPMPPKSIMKATGMLMRSGHLYDVLHEEVKKGRIQLLVIENIRCYRLTGAGLKAFRSDAIEEGRNAGKRIGKGRKLKQPKPKKRASS